MYADQILNQTSHRKTNKKANKLSNINLREANQISYLLIFFKNETTDKEVSIE